MKTSLWNRMRRDGHALGIVLAAALLPVACDTTQPLTETDTTGAETQAVTEELQSTLQLDAAQTAELGRLLGRLEQQEREPGALWTVAAALHERLNEAQRERLREQVAALQERAGAERPGPFRRPGRRDRQGAPAPFGDRGPLADDLTDEQRAALEELRDRFREQMQTLRQQRQDGTLTDEDFRRQIREQASAMREAAQALLTEEQQAALAARQEERRRQGAERREAARAARAEALGLTAEQQAALERLVERHREAVQALFREVRDGTRDREALRDELQTLRAEHRAEVAGILTEAQQEIVALHHLLAARVLRQAAKDHARPGFGARRR
ncbi:hypothetical protein GQ464_016825 [Rhodocaloribacter litoris]|uniref:hypothetical protein n=1 Tax=Rhodocaloribacter litoris TaxID=2558931 RepID=UPI001422F66F|nr:hypothetical protein [Rhodocaloribacter litoris]QXD15049.1 hypothetical protein GQ464_016825 [Rhodocaloribacter litoris]